MNIQRDFFFSYPVNRQGGFSVEFMNRLRDFSVSFKQSDFLSVIFWTDRGIFLHCLVNRSRYFSHVLWRVNEIFLLSCEQPEGFFSAVMLTDRGIIFSLVLWTEKEISTPLSPSSCRGRTQCGDPQRSSGRCPWCLPASPSCCRRPDTAICRNPTTSSTEGGTERRETCPWKTAQVTASPTPPSFQKLGSQHNLTPRKKSDAFNLPIIFCKKTDFSIYAFCRPL